MKKWADGKRRHVEYSVGDLVMVKNLPTQHKSTRPLHKGLVRKYEGPFPIAKRVGNVSYKVELPSRLRLHPVFHASCLKPYHGDAEDTERGPQTRAPLGVSTSYDKEAELILDVRTVRKKNCRPSREYLVKWKDCSIVKQAGNSRARCGSLRTRCASSSKDATRASREFGGGECHAPSALKHFLEHLVRD